ncbi:MAG: pilus assembly protein N-terminal domain-containing protein [Pirellulales bacterium]|nr:pilus assembly protein N-terminal domain-containing protein [Pirellulales bacterium]
MSTRFFAHGLRCGVLAALLVPLAWCAAPALGQLPGPTPIEYKVAGNHDRLEMVVNSSRHLVMDKKIPQAQVNNPDILSITPLSANKVQISAKKPGVTQVNLWDEDEKVHSIDVIVFADAQELTELLRWQFPKAQLRVIPLANSVVITGYVDDPSMVSRIVQIAEDFHPKVLNQISVGGVQQVLLYVKVMEVSRTKLRHLGVDLANLNKSWSFATGISGLIRASSGVTRAITTAGSETVTAGVFQGSNTFFAVLQALRQNDLLKIMAEPDLVCVSGRPAYFNVGGEFPILVPQSLGTVSIQYKRFGTQLDFVPIVLGNGLIRLEVKPRVSEIDPTRSVIINGTTVPGLRVREVETGVEMRAGETLAIAGLVQNRVEAQNRGLPWLGDIPILGTFFSARREQVNEIETLILVTPQFVEAMPCDQVPPGGPGLNTQSPSDCQLYLNGHIEVPLNPDRSAQPGAFPPPGPSAIFVPDENGGGVVGDDLIGLPPGAISSEVVPPPAEAPADVEGAAPVQPTPVPAPMPEPDGSATAPAPTDATPTPSSTPGAASRRPSSRVQAVGARPVARPTGRSAAAASSGPQLRRASSGGPNLPPVPNAPRPPAVSPQNRPNRSAPTKQSGFARESSRPGLIGPSGYDVDK